jgi:hypothetical protein
MNGTQQLGQGAAGGAAGAGGQGMPQGMPPGGMPQGGPPGAHGAFGFVPGGPIASMVILGIFVATLIVLAIVFFKLFQKAGFSGALGLLMLIPVVNLGVALYLAFAEWPVLAELARVKLLAASKVPAAPTAVLDSAAPSQAPDAAPPSQPADASLPLGA